MCSRLFLLVASTITTTTVIHVSKFSKKISVNYVLRGIKYTTMFYGYQNHMIILVNVVGSSFFWTITQWHIVRLYSQAIVEGGKVEGIKGGGEGWRGIEGSWGSRGHGEGSVWRHNISVYLESCQCGF
jgi:hypothetical protein